MANKAEEQRPWEIIIVRAACHPQEENDKAAAIIRPM